jgi:hypothetical protein
MERAVELLEGTVLSPQVRLTSCLDAWCRFEGRFVEVGVVWIRG